MDVLITACGEANEITPPNQHLTVQGTLAHKVCVHDLCVCLHLEMEKIIRPEVLIKA